jgi:hypothetical protein
LARVTSISNRTEVPAAATNPEFALTVLRKRTCPVTPDSTVKAAPVPSPSPDTAAVKFVVPLAVPPAIVKSWPPPAKLAIEMSPAFEFKLTGPPDSRRLENVIPSKLDQFKPSSVASPAMFVAVKPSASVTSPSN